MTILTMIPLYQSILAVLILGSLALIVSMQQPTPQLDSRMLVYTSVYKLLESGQVDQSLDTDTLLSQQELLVQTIDTLRDAQWSLAGENAIKEYNKLLEQIQQVLNRRHGVDGMTHLSQ